ncbi:hypothetical protein NDU88_007355 [Pleurodeles waltl]|uniref:Uncharacterized protein n=1 Tax=Pleurodeles waltl TaxID=8319 RepID=A0AAV7QRD9_PLEWA|nr:hypothetical protein NDU88_007355 [Pleurodeles waltl]
MNSLEIKSGSTLEKSQLHEESQCSHLLENLKKTDSGRGSTYLKEARQRENKDLARETTPSPNTTRVGPNHRTTRSSLEPSKSCAIEIYA